MNGSGKEFLIIFVLILALFLMAIFGIGTNGSRPTGEDFLLHQDNRKTQTRGEITQDRTQPQQSTPIMEPTEGLVGVGLELTKLKNITDTSPYKGMVKIGRQTYGPRSTNVLREYITLITSSGNQSGIEVSDWKLVSVVSGNTVTIGKATERIYAGSVNLEQPIILRPKEVMYVVTGRSPLGVSFKVNKCTGYFTQFQGFIPTLRKSCPRPNEEIVFYKDDASIFFDNACMDFVNRLRTCEVYTRPLPLTLSRSCREAIVGEINYNSCLDNHQNDSDFDRLEWRVFLKRDRELWRDKREIIKLVDDNGKIVDYYSY